MLQLKSKKPNENRKLCLFSAVGASIITLLCFPRKKNVKIVNINIGNADVDIENLNFNKEIGVNKVGGKKNEVL